MASSSTLLFLLLTTLFLQFNSGTPELQLNFYADSCPHAQDTVKQQVQTLYYLRYTTAISWLRNFFHDCIVNSCDASLLLDTVEGMPSEKLAVRSFGMRNFGYVNTIKSALEAECPNTVSCADIMALSAGYGSVMLGGPQIEMKTGRRDGKISYFTDVDKIIPDHNASMSVVLSAFQSAGIDAEGTVALLGGHSLGRVHCVNLVHRLYPTVDPTLDPAHAKYLKHRCPSPVPNPSKVEYARNDLDTPTVLDNNYYKNLIKHKGLLTVDQQLLSDPITSDIVLNMAANNTYFHTQFARAMLILSENNPLTGDQGEIRKDCRHINRS